MTLKNDFNATFTLSRRIRAIIALSRPRTCFLSVFSYLLAFYGRDIDWNWRIYAGLFASYLVSAIANFHNATTDFEEDSVFLSNRVQVVRDIGTKTVRTILISSSLVLAFSLGVASMGTLLIMPFGIFLLFMYSAEPLRLKTRPFWGMLNFALVGVLPYIGGSLINGSYFSISHERINFSVALLLLLLLSAKFYIKNLPDYESDGKAGLRTTATLFQSYIRSASVAVSMEVFAYISIAIYVYKSSSYSLQLVLFFGALILAIVNSFRFIRQYDALILNMRMKWDMFFTALILALWSFPDSCNEFCVAWTAMFALFLFAMFIPLDSRAGSYITKLVEEK